MSVSRIEAKLAAERLKDIETVKAKILKLEQEKEKFIQDVKNALKNYLENTDSSHYPKHHVSIR